MNDRYIKVKDHNNLVKDSVANAVLNSDTDSFLLFKSKREKERKVEERLNNMESALCGIEAMLTKLLEKNNG